MYLRQLNVTTSGARVLGTPYCGILASQIASETASGDSGPGILYDRAIDPANTGKRLRAKLTTAYPTTWTLYVYENGAVEAFGAPDGVHTFSYEEYADEVLLGTDSFTITVGSTATISAVVADASFSGSAYSYPVATLSVTLDDSIFSGSASVSPLASISTTLDDVVFSGNSGVGVFATLSATTDESVFSGSALSSPIVVITAFGDDAVFAGSASSLSSSIGTIAATTGDSIFSGSATGSVVVSGITVEDILNAEIENGLSLREVLRLLLAVAAGDATGLENGSPVFKSQDGSKNRVVATYNTGTRTITSKDVT